MSNQIVPRSATGSLDAVGSRLPRRFARGLSEVEGATVVRAAAVQCEAIIAAEKIKQVDYLTWQAMSGHAQLAGWANHLAGEDPILHDELRFFKDTARLGKGEIIADTIDKFRRM
jgi:hypothetical protein